MGLIIAPSSGLDAVGSKAQPCAAIIQGARRGQRQTDPLSGTPQRVEASAPWRSCPDRAAGPFSLAWGGGGIPLWGPSTHPIFSAPPSGVGGGASGSVPNVAGPGLVTKAGVHLMFLALFGFLYRSTFFITSSTNMSLWQDS